VRAAASEAEKVRLLDLHLKAARLAAAEALPGRLAALRSSGNGSAEEAAAVDGLERAAASQARRWQAAPAAEGAEPEREPQVAAAAPAAVKPPPYATVDTGSAEEDGAKVTGKITGETCALPPHDCLCTGLSKRTPRGNYFKPGGGETYLVAETAPALLHRQLAGGANSCPFEPEAGLEPRSLRAGSELEMARQDARTRRVELELKPLVPSDINAVPFVLKRHELEPELEPEPGAAKEAAGGAEAAAATAATAATEPRVRAVVTNPCELRNSLHGGEEGGAFYDGVVDGGCAWAVLPLRCLADADADADADALPESHPGAAWEKSLRAGDDAAPFYDGVVDGPAPAWGEQLPADVIANDDPTEGQLVTLRTRAARWGGDGIGSAPSARWRARRCQALAVFFATRKLPKAEQGGPPKRESTPTAAGQLPTPPPSVAQPVPRMVAVPSPAFFATCLTVSRAEDAAANKARRGAEEASAREQLELAGSWLTVFPREGRWPTDSKWAQLNRVAYGESGFAFASPAALARFNRLLARRSAALLRRPPPPQLDKSSAAKEAVWVSGAALPAELEAATLALSNLKTFNIAELRSFAKPHQLVKDVASCVAIIKGVDDLSWEGARAMMGERGFLRSLVELDKDALSERQIEQVKAYFQTPNFTANDLMMISTASAGLLKWVQAVVHYFEVSKALRQQQKEEEQQEVQAVGVTQAESNAGEGSGKGAAEADAGAEAKKPVGVWSAPKPAVVKIGVERELRGSTLEETNKLPAPGSDDACASPDSIMTTGGLPAPEAYVAPDMTNLKQLARSVELLLEKVKPQAHVPPRRVL